MIQTNRCNALQLLSLLLPLLRAAINNNYAFQALKSTSPRLKKDQSSWRLLSKPFRELSFGVMDGSKPPPFHLQIKSLWGQRFGDQRAACCLLRPCCLGKRCFRILIRVISQIFANQTDQNSLIFRKSKCYLALFFWRIAESEGLSNRQQISFSCQGSDDAEIMLRFNLSFLLLSLDISCASWMWKFPIASLDNI